MTQPDGNNEVKAPVTKQVIGSLVAAVIIVIVTILVVTASIPAGGLDDDDGDRRRNERNDGDNSGPGSENSGHDGD